MQRQSSQSLFSGDTSDGEEQINEAVICDAVPRYLPLPSNLETDYPFPRKGWEGKQKN
jgi:hypothetical protein